MNPTPAFVPTAAVSPTEPPVPLPTAAMPQQPAPPPDEITALDALSLSALIARRGVSCVDVMQSYLARIDAINPGYNAIVARRDSAQLIDEARACDAELANGHSRGWLHGIPQAPKDLAACEGMINSRGSAIFAHQPADTDALFVARMRDAGAIFIGKTNTPEFGLGSHSFNDVYGATRNALNPALCAGGSSGGAAVALALHLLPVADGSDMMGSLRNPAAFNGVWGFRPSFGRVPMINMPEQFVQQLGVEGPMGRSPQDCARLLATQAGYDPRAPLALAGDGSEFCRVADLDANHLTSQPLAGKRIAWLGDLGGHLPFEAGVLDLARSAAEEMAQLGAHVEAAEPGFSPERLWSSWLVLRQCLQGGNLLPLAMHARHLGRMKPEAQWEADQAQASSVADLFAASSIRTEFYRAMLALFQRYDFVMLPSAQVFPFPIEQRWPAQIAGRTMDTYHRWMEVVLPATMAGLPAMSIPVLTGIGGDAPTRMTGCQLIGPPRDDMAVLSAATTLHLARGA